MAQHMKATFDWQLEVGLQRGQSDSQILNDAKTVMSRQTVKTFTDEMAKRGVFDYRFRSITNTSQFKVKPHIVLRPYGAGYAGAGLMATITGTTTIEFDDIPVAIAAIIAAIAVGIVAHAGTIVLVGIISILAIIIAIVTHVVITDITAGIQTTGEAIKQATSTSGGSALAIGVGILAIATAIIIAITFLPNLIRRAKSRYFK